MGGADDAAAETQAAAAIHGVCGSGRARRVVGERELEYPVSVKVRGTVSERHGQHRPATLL